MMKTSRPHTREASSRILDGNRNGRSRTFPLSHGGIWTSQSFGTLYLYLVLVRVEPVTFKLEESVHVMRSCSSIHTRIRESVLP